MAGPGGNNIWETELVYCKIVFIFYEKLKKGQKDNSYYDY